MPCCAAWGKTSLKNTFWDNFLQPRSINRLAMSKTYPLHDNKVKENEDEKNFLDRNEGCKKQTIFRSTNIGTKTDLRQLKPLRKP